jgi:transposase
LGRLTKERTGHRNRIQSLLVTVGVRMKVTQRFGDELETIKQWNGQQLPTQLAAEIKREYSRLKLVEEQMREIREQIKVRIKEPQNKSDEKAADLTMLVAIGRQGAWVLSKELFGWRSFQNRGEVGSLVGLTPMPYDSGESEREQGISKAGNRRVRTLLTQLAWGWLRFQPQSRLAIWYQERFGRGNKRSRRVGIIALARRLLIALWHYVEHGVVPEGARMRAVLA